MERLVLILPLLVLLAAGCGNVATTGVGGEPPSQPNIPGKDMDTNRRAEVRLVDATNRFGFALLQQLQRSHEEKNVFFSPMSVILALTMAYNGAAGETEQAMAKALALEGMSKQEVNDAVLRLRRTLRGDDKGVEIRIANSLWARQGVTFRPQFLEVNRRYFEAQIRVLDFADPAAADAINQWVETSTNGRIKKMVEQIPPDTVMYLLNAVYFNGKWSRPFDQSLTAPLPFHLANGERKQVPMMPQDGSFAYLKGEGFQMVRLPYGEGRFYMVIALPDEGVKLSEWLKGVSAKQWQAWTQRLSLAEGEVKIPRFQMGYEQTLNDALKALGMEVAFLPDRADFRHMREQRDLFIQKVHHKAVVEVNEAGTEAAAVTSVQIGITAAPMPRPRFQMVVDRPFLFAIQEGQSGAILFLGAVYDPE